MAEEDELKQLRAQRQKVAEHLSWLDQLIINCEAEAQVDGAEIDSDLPEPLYENRLPEMSLTEEEEPPLESLTPEYVPSRDSQDLKSNLQRQRFGCVVMAVLVLAIAFFTLWVLPGLIYD